jgi:hypothetical protein
MKDQDERDALNASRSLQRTKSKARCYAVQNLLTKNWTLTWAGPGEFDKRAARRRVNRFLTRLREELGEDFPYLYVIEVHPGLDGPESSHGYHVHLLLDNRFIDKYRMQALWGSIVHYSAHEKLGRGQGARQHARIAVMYLMKYLSKDWEAGSGEHRYERSNGHNVRTVRTLCRSFAEAARWIASMRENVPVIQRFDSSDLEDWHGPPVVWIAW